MRSCRSLLAKQVVNLEDGSLIGFVKDVYFDAKLNYLSGFFLGTVDGLGEKDSFIGCHSVFLFGKDVLMISSADAIMESYSPEFDYGWIRREQLIDRLVQTESEGMVGMVEDIVLDEQNRVIGITVNVANLFNQFASNRLISRDMFHGLSSTEMALIVANAAVQEEVSMPFEWARLQLAV